MHATTIRSLLKEQCLRSAFSRSRHWAAGCVCLVAGSQRRRAALALRGAALGAFAVFFAVPLLWLALAPTKTDYELLTRSPLAVGNLDNVRAAWQALNAFENHIFRRWMENSLLYCLSATAITLVTAIPAGYGLAFSRFPGRKAILGLTLVSMLMPASSLVLPVFLELNAMRLIGSAFSIILPFAFFPFGIYLAYIYFATALPRDLLEAARIDGCTNLQTSCASRLPLSSPVATLIFFFSFVADWNNFLPSVRDPGRREEVPGPGGAFRHLPLDPAGRRTRVADRGASRRGRVRRLAASPRAGARRRRDDGLTRSIGRSTSEKHPSRSCRSCSACCATSTTTCAPSKTS